MTEKGEESIRKALAGSYADAGLLLPLLYRAFRIEDRQKYAHRKLILSHKFLPYSYKKYMVRWHVRKSCQDKPDSVFALKYQVEKVFSGLTTSHNIAPNQEIVIINDEGVRQLIQCK